MAKIHKRYNWKSRQIVKTVIDETEQNKIKVDFEDDNIHYDASNALALPSAKRKTKRIKDKNAAPVKLLSKKQRIKLKKITEKKLKNSQREALLEELQKVQAKPKELEMLTSLQTIQTMGRKKYLSSSFDFMPLTKAKELTQEEMAKLLKWKTPKAVKRELKAKESKPKRMKRDYNIVQSESSSSSEDEIENESATDSHSKEMTSAEVNDLIPQSNVIDCMQQNDHEIEEKEKSEDDVNSDDKKCKKEKKKKIAKKKKNEIEEKEKSEDDVNSDDKKCKKEKKIAKKKKNDEIEEKERSEDDVNSDDKKCKEEKKKKIAKKKKKNDGNECEKNKDDDGHVNGTLEGEDEDMQICKKKKLKSKKKKKNLNVENRNNIMTDSSPQEDKTCVKNKKLKKKKLKEKKSNSDINEKNEHDSANIPVNDIEIEIEESQSVCNESHIEQNPTTQNEPGKEEVLNSGRTFKLVERDSEIQKQRLKLPILSEEHVVMEAINENDITIIVGPTGSGKTTQVPQFLYEADYTSMGLIGITEPRRIAAISMADRVGFELNLPSSKVSYQIRYEGNTTEDTEIKFMTDGVLFQEIRNNHYLDNYSAIIIDEVHERSVHSDILLGLLSRIVPIRNQKGKPLKLIIMSATPRIEDFTQNANLFKGGIPPVIQIPSRLYSVSAYFSKHTDPNYCEAAYKTICKIHKQQPDGGILIFLTGQQEIKELCDRLKKTFPYRRSKNEDENGNFCKRLTNKKEKRKKSVNSKKVLPEVNLKDYARKDDASQAEDEDKIRDEEIFRDEISEGLFNESGQPLEPLWILPLYSLLPSHKQKRVFEPPPEGTRLCVVSTNVAETSLTIPNVKYIIDSGKAKEKFYDPVTGISSFHVTWTNQASATQRAGRAGRTSDGICYRLYSSAVYNDEFPKYAIPDIQRRPLDDVVLTMKALKVPVYSFPFPSPPDPQQLGESFKRLTILGALEESQTLLKIKKKNHGKQIDTTVITKAGRSMSYLPMAPRFAKIVLNCHQHPEIYPYIVILIAALTVREIMIEIPMRSKDGDHDPAHENWRARRLKWAGEGQEHLLGDLLVLINAVLEAEQNNFAYQWCYQHGLRHSALLEYRKLRRQLTNEINLLIDDANLSISPDLKSPTANQAYLMAEVIFMGSKDQLARKVDPKQLQTDSDKKLWKNAYRSLYSDKPVFLSSASVLYEEKPKYIMYQQIYESTKVYLRGATVINEAWMLLHGGTLIDLSPPLDNPEPKYDFNSDKVLCHRSGTFGPNKWELKPYEVEYPLSVELFKWVAYFFLTGDMWMPLKSFAKYLHDPKTLISPITLRFREKRQNLIRALSSRTVVSAKSLRDVWSTEPNFLKQEYFAWFENEDKLGMLNAIWPPVKEDDFMFIKEART